MIYIIQQTNNDKDYIKRIIRNLMGEKKRKFLLQHI